MKILIKQMLETIYRNKQRNNLINMSTSNNKVHNNLLIDTLKKLI